jgi:hypothetical protein
MFGYVYSTDPTAQNWHTVLGALRESHPEWFVEGNIALVQGELADVIRNAGPQGALGAVAALVAREQFAQDNPAFSAAILNMDPSQFEQTLRQIIQFRFPQLTNWQSGIAQRLAAEEFGELAAEFGDAIFMLNDEERNQVLGIIGDAESIPELSGAKRAEINTILSDARDRYEVEEGKEAGLDLVYGLLDDLQELKGELWTPQNQEFEDQLYRYATGDIKPISDEYVQRAITEMDRIINRTFGTAANIQGTVGAARGQAGSAFATQMSQQLQARSLEAKIGARFEALNFQEATNASIQKEMMALYALTGDRRRAQQLLLARIVGDTTRLAAGIESGTITMPDDYSDWPLLVESMQSLLEAGEDFDLSQLDWSDPAKLGENIAAIAGMAITGGGTQQLGRILGQLIER